MEELFKHQEEDFSNYSGGGTGKRKKAQVDADDLLHLG